MTEKEEKLLSALGFKKSENNLCMSLEDAIFGRLVYIGRVLYWKPKDREKAADRTYLMPLEGFEGVRAKILRVLSEDYAPDSDDAAALEKRGFRQCADMAWRYGLVKAFFNYGWYAVVGDAVLPGIFMRYPTARDLFHYI